MTKEPATSGGKLTTHVLDTALGRPARSLKVTLHRIEGERLLPLAEGFTNADGRLDSPLLEGETFTTGTFEIVFHAGDYLRRAGHDLPEPPFLDRVPVRFGMAEPKHYHVPLLLSPFGYSTYRGS